MHINSAENKRITKRLKTPKEVEQYFLGFLAFIDSTDQQIPRPIDKRKRKSCHSGKKRHTIDPVDG